MVRDKINGQYLFQSDGWAPILVGVKEGKAHGSGWVNIWMKEWWIEFACKINNCATEMHSKNTTYNTCYRRERQCTGSKKTKQTNILAAQAGNLR